MKSRKSDFGDILRQWNGELPENCPDIRRKKPADFGEILNRWDKMQDERKTVRRPVTGGVKQDFGDVLKQWSQFHNDLPAMAKKVQNASVVTVEMTVSQLRKMRVQDELDLHGYSLSDALAAAGTFIDDSYCRGLRKIRIITGKGLHSPNGKSVVREPVISLVRRNSHVRELDVHPKAEDGGSGAVIIILKSNSEPIAKFHS